MPSTVVNYDLLISCPGDVDEAVKIVEEVVSDFNQKYLDTLNISIRIRYWKNSSFPESGGKPQALLNKQFVNDADLAVAIFKTRFGSPTDKYGSGSEEEIAIMLEAGKQVFMYFDDSPVPPSTIDNEQYQKVQEFKRKYQDLGIYNTFTSLEEFRKNFDAHISRYFLTLDVLNEINNGNISDIKVLANNTYSEALVEDFNLGLFPSSKNVIDEIRGYYEAISAYHIGNELPEVFQGLNKKVSIDDGMKDIIISFAEHMSIQMGDSFFDLGNLKESVLSSNPLMGKSLIGEENEKNKYNDIIQLKKRIVDLLGYIEIEKLYGNLGGIQLILSNEGKSFDEDIDIELIFPKDVIIMHQELMVPKGKVDCEDWCYEDIFEMPECREYISYNKTKRNKNMTPNYSAPILPFQSYDYEKGYRDTIDGIFAYDYFHDEKSDVIKVHFDYLKHNQKAAFPTWIFIRESAELPIEMEYRIISKNNPKVQTGSITIKK